MKHCKIYLILLSILFPAALLSQSAEKASAKNQFVLFDVEVIFMYPWAVNFREMGFEGFAKMGIFMLLLVVGFFYVQKKKGLEWE